MTGLQQSSRLGKKCPTQMGSWPAGLVINKHSYVLSWRFAWWNEEANGGWYRLAKFRVSCVFGSRWGSERLPGSLLRFPHPEKVAAISGWGCGPFTSQAFRLDLTQCFKIRVCQLFVVHHFLLNSSGSRPSKSRGLACQGEHSAAACVFGFFCYC